MTEKKDGRKNHSLREFGGVNTQAARQTIKDDEFSWLEDVMPIGFGNMPVVPGPSASFATIPGSGAYYIQSLNISNAGIPTEYVFVFCSSGNAYMAQVQSPWTVTQIGVNGQFSTYGVRAAQWKDERILIIDPVKGYFDWGYNTISIVLANASITSNVLTFSSATGGTVAAGQYVFYPSGTAYCQIQSGSGTTWTVSSCANLASTTMWAGQFALTTYQGTVFSVTVVSGGTGFIDNHTQTITNTTGTGGPGTGATYTYYIGVVAITLTGTQTNYSVGQVLTLMGGTTINNQACQITIASVGTGGAITGANITVPGVYTIAPSPLTGLATSTVGSGSGCTVTAAFGIVSVTVTAPGSGYSNTAPNTPLALTISGASTGASLTPNLSSSTVGTDIATYSGRVWIANGRTIVYSAPNSYQDFTTTSLGGSFIMTDSTLRSQIYRLFSANNYLYIFGIDSINAISGVAIQPATVSSSGTNVSPAITIFTNSNLTPSMGTDMPDSIIANYRTLMFSNDYGVYGLNGVMPQKMSDPLDGMFQDINLNYNISAGQAIIFNIQCMCFLVTYDDQLLGYPRQLLMVYFNKKWFFSTQVPGMIFITTGIYNGTPTLFATDGSYLYRCFDQTTQPHAHEIQTKLWDFGSPLVTKQAFKFALESISPILNAAINVSVDTEIKSLDYAFVAGNTMLWTNNTGGIITWTNNSAQTIIWTVSGYNMNRADVSNTGNYLGLTITSTSNELTYAGLHLQYEPRTPWTGAPF